MLTPRTWVSAASSLERFLLEGLHLLASTTGECENVERQCHILLALNCSKETLLLF